MWFLDTQRIPNYDLEVVVQNFQVDLPSIPRPSGRGEGNLIDKFILVFGI